jgi:hypothetical protein
VGVTFPGDTAAVQTTSPSSKLDCGVGGAIRSGTVVSAPLIPRLGEGRGPNPPSTTGQSSTPPSSNLFTENPLCGPLRQYRKQQNKGRKTSDRTKKKQNAEAVVGWGGYNLIPSTDAKGIPSNLVFPTGGTRLGCSSTSPSNCCANLCSCSPCRDTSLVAGSRDMSPGGIATTGSTPSPSTCLSVICSCRLSPSVCLCRDYEKTQG